MAYRATKTTNQQQYLDSTHILNLLNSKASSTCCVGLTTKQKRCTKGIAKQNVSAAKAVFQTLNSSQPLTKSQGYRLILNLATLTLCPGYHRDQAQSVSQRWLREVDWGFTPEPKPSGDKSQKHSRHKNAAEYEAEIRRAAEKTRREEARRQAHREKAERAWDAAYRRFQEKAEAEAKKTAEEEAKKQAEEAARERSRREKAEKAESDRLRREQEEKDRLKREREAEQQRQKSKELSWEDSWDRYEKACSKLANSGRQPTNREIETLLFWPTRAGSYSSCKEATVKEFFAHRPQSFDRKAFRKQTMRWHPDRATVLFAHAQDAMAIQKVVTMVTQVITGIMETYPR